MKFIRVVCDIESDDHHFFESRLVVLREIYIKHGVNFGADVSRILNIPKIVHCTEQEIPERDDLTQTSPNDSTTLLPSIIKQI